MSHRHRMKTDTWKRGVVTEECSCGATRTFTVTATSSGVRRVEHRPWIAPDVSGVSSWKVFMVFGSFTEPTSGQNVIIVRMPAGRQPWAKKIVPAIQKLVAPWFPKMMRGDRFWSVEGEAEGQRLWETKLDRYEWNGARLVRA